MTGSDGLWQFSQEPSCILCNFLLFLGKYIVGTVTGSIAIAADGVNNLSDASSNLSA